MSDTADAVRVLSDIAYVAAQPGSARNRATALLEPLHRLFPFDGAWIALRDEARHGHHSLVSTGWDQDTAAYLDGPVLVDEIEQLGMTRTRLPLRVADFPVPPRDLLSWAECLWPAGFREGLGLCLFADDGRHLGFLGLFSTSRSVPSTATRDVLADLAPTLARAIDPLRTAAAAAQLVHGALAAATVTRSGDVLALPGLPGHHLLRPGSRVVGAACDLLDAPLICFVAPDRSHPERHLAVSALETPDDAHQLRAVIVLSSCGEMQGLTRRELEVLGLVIAGHQNAEVAHDLCVTPRTVATHIEHILLKLDAGTRALAAVRAQRRGWYIPPALLTDPPT